MAGFRVISYNPVGPLHRIHILPTISLNSSPTSTFDPINQPRNFDPITITMNTFSTLLLLLLAAISRTGLAFDELNDVAIRVIVNRGVADELCSAADQRNLRSVMEAALPRQRLRNSAARRKLQADCSDLCDGLTGCFVMHPQCRGAAAAEPEDDDGVAITSNDDVPPVDPEFDLGEDELTTCAGQRARARTQMKEVFSSDAISPGCKSLVQSTVHMECVVVDRDLP